MWKPSDHHHHHHHHHQILLIEKYYVKSLKRNKLKSSDIRGLWEKKKYSEENIVLVHWQILQLLILADNIIEVVELISSLFFFMLCNVVLLILVFWTNYFCQFKEFLSNFASAKFVSEKQKFAWIAKKLTLIASLNIKLLKICLLQFTPDLLHIWQKCEQPLMNASKTITFSLSPVDCVKNLILSEAAVEWCSTE